MGSGQPKDQKPLDDEQIENLDKEFNDSLNLNLGKELKNDNNTDNIDNEIYYFQKPENNTFTDEQLLNMPIVKISIGMHMTKIPKKPENENISFHPFFFLELKNRHKIGVIVQYLIIPEEQKHLTHLWEEDGVEYLEKPKSTFSKEYVRMIIKTGTKDLCIDDWLIDYTSLEFGNMNLRQFFEKIIPIKGEWIQKKLNIKNHACIHFTIESIKNLGIKKDKDEIEPVKERMMKNFLGLAKNQKNYDLFEKGFNQLFNTLIN